MREEEEGEEEEEENFYHAKHVPECLERLRGFRCGGGRRTVDTLRLEICEEG